MEKNIKIMRDGQLFYWQLGGYKSNSFPVLEQRPWTPIIIENSLCFVAGNHTQSCVVWNDQEGEWFDDVYDLSNDQNVPTYIARNSQNWVIVRGEKKSKLYPFQLTYKECTNGVAVLRFSDWKPWKNSNVKEQMLELISRSN